MFTTEKGTTTHARLPQEQRGALEVLVLEPLEPCPPPCRRGSAAGSYSGREPRPSQRRQPPPHHPETHFGAPGRRPRQEECSSHHRSVRALVPVGAGVPHPMRRHSTDRILRASRRPLIIGPVSLPLLTPPGWTRDPPAHYGTLWTLRTSLTPGVFHQGS